MACVGRFANLFRRARLNREIEEELASHIAEAIEQGRSPEEARRAFGSPLQFRERSRDIRLLPWLDSLAADAVFGFRQLKRHRAASIAAVLSLGLAIGATTAAFRLVDAVLWRTLPVAEPESLSFLVITQVNREGRPDYRDDYDYPSFRRISKMIEDRASVLLVGSTFRVDVAFGSAGEIEKVYRQHVSGNVFGVFGLRPALGRLLTPNDDVTPGAHALAVLSYDFWSRRFGRDPGVLGRTFRLGSQLYEIIGVAPKGFIGTQPGIVAEVFIPSTMNTRALNSPGWSWFQIWVRPKPGFSPEQIRQPLQADLIRDHQERIRRWDSDTPKQNIDAFLKEEVQLLPAAQGASDMQKNYRRPLLILGILVALVLLIACANVGNLLTAQAAARAREMALRVSIGAGRWRLMQLVLVESALLAVAASAAGAIFASWSAPLVVSMLAPPQDPVRLILDADWRAVGFGVGLTAFITLLFGLAPALRASGVKPSSALKGGEDPHSRRRLMHSLVAAQMAFSVLVLFTAGLFVTTFQRLSNRPLGFSHERVLLLETEGGDKLPPETRTQLADQLRRLHGVESVAQAGWALLSGNGWTTTARVPGRPVEVRSPYALDVSPGFFETMRIGMIDGRDFRAGDVQPGATPEGQPKAGVAIVNEAFARIYFDGQNPVGRLVNVGIGKDLSAAVEIVGYVRDAAYRNPREPMRPTLYVPIEKNRGTYLVRTAGNPTAFAATLRREMMQAESGLQVRNVETQSALVRRHMIRERLLATLSFFFAAVALALAGIGLYGVLNYSVVQQRREIGIRIALGARLGHVVRRVSTAMFAMVCIGSGIGLAAGLAGARFIESLLFEVRSTDLSMLAAPLVMLFTAAVLAAVPPAIRAARIDPAETLRSE